MSDIEDRIKAAGDEMDGAQAQWETANGRYGRALIDLAETAKAAVVDKDKKIAALQATIDTLPKYADTGEAFVPGRDEAWIWLDGKAQPVSGEAESAVGVGKSRFDGVQWKHYCDIRPGIVDAYSTPEAAEAAKDSQ